MYVFPRFLPCSDTGYESCSPIVCFSPFTWRTDVTYGFDISVHLQVDHEVLDRVHVDTSLGVSYLGHESSRFAVSFGYVKSSWYAATVTDSEDGRIMAKVPTCEEIGIHFYVLYIFCVCTIPGLWKIKITITSHKWSGRQDDERRHSDLYSRVEPVIYSDLVGLNHLTVIE